MAIEIWTPLPLRIVFSNALCHSRAVGERRRAPPAEIDRPSDYRKSGRSSRVRRAEGKLTN
jgi:hypothetical protein